MSFGETPINRLLLGLKEIYTDYTRKYLTFNVISSGTIRWKQFGSQQRTIYYSKDYGETWTEWTSNTTGVTIDVVEGDQVLVKGNNINYSSDKNNYSGFDGGTAMYNIEGNIMSLQYSDDFKENNALRSSWSFCSLFKQSNIVSAKNLILPATSLTDYCYRALFSKAAYLIEPPALPATSLSVGCYWYMFENCPITKAPELKALTLANESYGHMFEGCASLSYVKCLALNRNATNCTQDWIKNVASTGTFIKNPDTEWGTGTSGVPDNWEVVDNELPEKPVIDFNGIEIELSCATSDAKIYYKLNNSSVYTLYTETISIGADTFIEAFSKNNSGSSGIVSKSCTYDTSTPLQYANRNINSWTYNNNTIDLPYSVNAIDGHYSSYATGGFTFETDITIRRIEPTYLWFQHADQTAQIYVDNNLVEKHWGGYTAFFSDITNYIHKGTNTIKVVLKNNEGNVLAPYAGDFNFNATLGKVKVLSSPALPSKEYGYDGFHITSDVTDEEATIYVRTTIPSGASATCNISDNNYTFTETKNSYGSELTFIATIQNPHLWNGTLDPHLYNISLDIYYNNTLYHSFTRPYGLRYYEYVINDTEKVGTVQDPYTGFLLNGAKYLLRGVCMHDDLVNKANALDDSDYIQEFNIISELGCNFLRLAHYPHPKEVYDKCDQLGIIVQTEAPWVNKSSASETQDYWTHLEGQISDMVNQHYNHPCILFWGVGNEINTNYTNTTEGKDFIKGKIEGYRTQIRTLLPGAWVGYTVSHSTSSILGVFNYPTVDWVGGNIYVGWYIQTTSNNPSGELDKRVKNSITDYNIPLAYSEYGCGGTQKCHSDNPTSTTTTGNNPRHDIEYMMWLHEGHIAAIKNYPNLLFSAEWQLFDIAVTNRQEGYKECLDGETATDNNNLKRLNDKGLVERDHKTKKDTFYLYKAWWNTTDKFVHICGKNYLKATDRIIKCYSNNGPQLSLYVNNELVETITSTDNIFTFTTRNFSNGDVIKVQGSNSNDQFTLITYEYVDLGLPSGIKWCTKNVGAISATDSGQFFSWGNINGHYSDYDFSQSVYNNTDGASQQSDISVTSGFDMVRTNIGATWRLPTKQNFQELYDNCTWTWTTIDGVSGYLVTSNIEGYTSNSIFLPAAGEYSSDAHSYGNDIGGYWSNGNRFNTYAYCLLFNSTIIEPQSSYNKYIGYTIRGVMD